MEQIMEEIVIRLRHICECLDTIAKVQEHIARVPLEQRRRWTKQEVIDEFKMSDSTYKRNISSELLKPMRLSGFDEYFEEHLLEALEESRRRGRI